jgi:cytochrome P450
VSDATYDPPDRRAAAGRPARWGSEPQIHRRRDPMDGLRLIDPRAYSEHGYPHAEWKQLRQQPLTYFEPEGWQSFWAITKHADVIEVSKQPDLFLNGPGMTLIRKRDEREDGSFMEMRTIINMDQPDHRKYRKVASPWFTPRALKRLDPLVKQTARELVDSLGTEGECDFVQTIASIHPLKVIARILGVPVEDEPFILRVTNELFGAEDPEFQRSEDVLQHRMTLGKDFFEYFTKVLEDRRTAPRDDLVSVIANAEVDGKPMGPMETMGYCLITFTAGHETTRGGIGGGFLALIENPGERERLAREPDGVLRAVDELIRYVTPVNHMVRTATADYPLRGSTIRKGDKLVIFYASANRDEDVFDDPETLRLERHPNPHLAFGVGEHFCLGANLARKTTGALMRELIPRLEHVELTGAPERTASNLVPGLKHLPVRYRIRPAADA